MTDYSSVLRPLTHSLSVAILCVVLSGCGGGPERSPTATVTGTVTLDDQPIEAGAIIFESDSTRPASGKIIDGKIVEVMTYEAGDGVPIGTQRVAIQAASSGESVEAADPSASGPVNMNYMGGGDSLVSNKYTDPKSSGLTAEIVVGENQLSFKLKSE
ncbi:MAG: hypothetical protein P8M30_10505 [Planctomycetaceae bacterium]|nr:hypothetical protein [Planctomycetaceae bacterium]